LWQVHPGQDRCRANARSWASVDRANDSVADLAGNLDDHVAQRTRSRSRPKLPRPNICIFSILMWLTSPSATPELNGMVSPAVTATWFCLSPRVKERSAERPAAGRKRHAEVAARAGPLR
jgi:hypothetical protein